MRRQEATGRNSRRLLWGLVALAVVCLVVGTCAALSSNSGVSTSEPVQPVVTAPVTPDPSESATPTATPTPTPDPTPTQPVECGAFDAATTITAESAGIANHPVREFTDADIETASVFNPYTGSYEETVGVSPEGEFDMVFYNRLANPGSCLSSLATNTNYLYCHSYGWDPALCNGMPAMLAGSTVVITTSTERLTYTMVKDSFPVYKVDFKTNEEVILGQGGRLVIVTCRKDGERDGNNRTTQNTVSILHLTKVESLVEPTVVEIDPRIAARLE